jgi:uncharacterized protein YjcR
MENKVEKQAKFIELRAKGNSYDNIVKKLGISKNTLLKWSKEFEAEIEDATIFEKDALMERYKMTELHLLEMYGEELKSIREDLLNWNSITNPETNRNDIAVQERIIEGIRKIVH